MRAERDEVGAGSRRAALLWRLLAGMAAIGADTSAFSQTTPPEQTGPVVRVDGGELQGVVDDGVASFKGIPFAAPPAGELRWRPPQPAAKWTGRAPGRGLRVGLHAGTFRAAPGPGCASCASSLGGLPVPERLAPRERHGHGEAARDGLDSRGRVRGRLGSPRLSRRGFSSPSRASSWSASTTAWGALASSRFPRSAASVRTRPRATTRTWTRSRPSSG